MALPGIFGSQIGDNEIDLQQLASSVLALIDNTTINVGNATEAVSVGDLAAHDSASGGLFYDASAVRLRIGGAGSGSITVPGAGLNSQQFGTLSAANAPLSLAVGHNALVDAASNSSLAIGPDAEINSACTQFGIALGGGVRGSGTQPFVNGDFGIAIGYNTLAGNSSVAMGPDTSAAGTGAVAIGDNAGTGGNGVSIGTGATSVGGGIAIGNAADGSTGGNVIGAGSLGTSSSLSVGLNATSVALATAIGGTGATASGLRSIALGSSITASAADAIVIGSQASSATQAGAIAIGTSTFSFSTGAVALGENVSLNASSDSAVGIGEDALIGVGSPRAMALGFAAEVGGSHTDSVSIKSVTTSANQVAVGRSTQPLTQFVLGPEGPLTDTDGTSVSWCASSVTPGTGNTDFEGASLLVKSGSGTGAGTVSTITFQTPDAGATSDTAQTLVNRLILSETNTQVVGDLDVTGNLTFGGGGGATFDFLNLGASTDGVATGDLGAGTAATGGLFYDASANTLTLGSSIVIDGSTDTIRGGDQTPGGGNNDAAGDSVLFRSGAGTGAGAVSTIVLQTPTAGASGDAAQVLANRLTVSEVDTTVHNNLVVTGDLSVNGTTTTIDTTNLVVEDRFAIFSKDAATGVSGGVVIERGSTGDDALMMWSETGSRFEFGFADTTGGTGNPAGVTTLGAVAFAGGSFDLLNVGSATDAVSTGDLAAGTSASSGLFYDASETRLTVGFGAANQGLELKGNGALFATPGALVKAEDAPGTNTAGSNLEISAGYGDGTGSSGFICVFPGNSGATATSAESVYMFGGYTGSPTVAGAPSATQPGGVTIEGGIYDDSVGTGSGHGGNIAITATDAVDGGAGGSLNGGNVTIGAGNAIGGTTGSILFQQGYNTPVSLGSISSGGWSVDNFMNVGAATGAVATGDFAAGTAATGGLFYDASAVQLTVGSTVTIGANSVTVGSAGSGTLTCPGAGSNAEQFGQGAVAAFAASVAVGNGATPDAINQFVAGSNTAGLFEVVFGRGPTLATTSTINDLTFRVTDRTTVADEPGQNLIVRSGRGTGNAAATTVSFRTPNVGASGTTQQTDSPRFTVGTSLINFHNTPASGVSYLNLGSATDAVSSGDIAAGTAASGGLFYDASANALSVGSTLVLDGSTDTIHGGDETPGGGNNDAAGDSIVVRSGSGTGAGTESTVKIQSPTAGASGDSAQVLADRLTVGTTIDFHNTPVTNFPTSGFSFLNLGSATDAVATGDLAAGTAATGGLFYDASANILTVGSTVAIDGTTDTIRGGDQTPGGGNNDAAGDSLVVRAGLGTGAATGAALTFRSPTAVVSGDTAQTDDLRLTVGPTGVTTTGSPAASGTGAEAWGAGATAAGTAAIALGPSATATGNQSIAIGGSSGTLAFASCIAIGTGSDAGSASDSGTTVIGHEAFGGSCTDGIAIGRDASCFSNDDSIAIGVSSRANSACAGVVVIGRSANGNSAVRGVAIGFQADVDGDEAIGIGDDVQALSIKCVSIGDSAVASGGAGRSVAIGDTAHAFESSGIAIGFQASSGTGTQVIAIGEDATATQVSTITVVDFNNGSGDTITVTQPGLIGATVLTEGSEFTAVTDNDTTAENIRAAVAAISGLSATRVGAVVTVVGDLTNLQTGDATAWTVSLGADPDRCIAVGDGASVRASVDSIAIGTNATLNGEFAHNTCVVIGHDASVLDHPTTPLATSGHVVIGNGAGTDSRGTGSVAIGDGATVATPSTGSVSPVAIGRNALSESGGVAVGFGATTSTFTSCTMIGANATAAGNSAVCVGISTDAAATATAIGNTAQATATNAVALGSLATASQTSVVAIGPSSSATHAASICIGGNATSTAANQLVIGGSTFGVETMIVGEGDSVTTPSNITWRASDATAGGANNDKAGASITIDTGRGTGAGTPSAFVIRTPDPTTSGDTAQTLVERFRVDETGVSFGAFGIDAPLIVTETTIGSTVDVRIANAEVTGLSGADVTFASLIPAGSLVLGVTSRVTTAITGASAMRIGITTDDTMFGDGLAVSGGATTDLTDANHAFGRIFNAATDVIVRSEDAVFTGGDLRIAVHYIQLGAPTS